MFGFDSGWWNSLNWWNWALLVSLTLGAIAASVGVFSTYRVVTLQKAATEVAQHELELYKQEAGEKIAAANAVGETAKSEAAQARKQTALIEKETSALEADNLALQASLRPRRLSFIGWTDHPEREAASNEELKKFAGTIAFIQAVPDFEAQMFSRDIASILEQAGWKPQFVNETQSHMSEMSFPEGVSLFTLSDGKAQTEAGTALWLALTEAEVAMNGTGTFGSYAHHEIIDERKPGYPYFEPPVTAIFVRVGVKPLTQQFIEIQRRNMERQDRRMDNALRAAYERSGSVLFSVPNHAPIYVKPGADGGWVAVNPAENSLLPKRLARHSFYLVE